MTTPDYREKYDHLWLEWVNERIREGERYLEKISHQLDDWKKTHNETERVRIATEVEMVLGSVKASLSRFETELKNPNLNLLEKYSLEKVKAEGDVVLKLLTEVQKTVAKK